MKNVINKILSFIKSLNEVDYSKPRACLNLQFEIDSHYGISPWWSGYKYNGFSLHFGILYMVWRIQFTKRNYR